MEILGVASSSFRTELAIPLLRRCCPTICPLRESLPRLTLQKATFPIDPQLLPNSLLMILLPEE